MLPALQRCCNDLGRRLDGADLAHIKARIANRLANLLIINNRTRFHADRDSVLFEIHRNSLGEC